MMTLIPLGSSVGALSVPAGAMAMGGLVLALVALTALVLLGGGRRRAS